MKSIPNFPGYKITENGHVWSDTSNRWLCQRVLLDGHIDVSLSKNGKGHTLKIHRLVLETYIGPRPKGMECRHLDGNPGNNALENLRWGTRIENVADALKHKSYAAGEKNGRAKLNNAQVRIIKWLLKAPNGLTQKEIATIFNITPVMVYYIKSGKRWKEV